jgi:hypothetical protein
VVPETEEKRTSAVGGFGIEAEDINPDDNHSSVDYDPGHTLDTSACNRPQTYNPHSPLTPTCAGFRSTQTCH